MSDTFRLRNDSDLEINSSYLSALLTERISQLYPEAVLSGCSRNSQVSLELTLSDELNYGELKQICLIWEKEERLRKNKFSIQL